MCIVARGIWQRALDLSGAPTTPDSSSTGLEPTASKVAHRRSLQPTILFNIQSYIYMRIITGGPRGQGNSIFGNVTRQSERLIRYEH